LHKRREYEWEKEVRVILMDETSALPRPTGRYMPCDLNALIDEVYVAPGSSEWFREDIAALLTLFGLTKPVLTSRIDDKPQM
jgi:hypothetical protein